jgi:hypothetical protein
MVIEGKIPGPHLPSLYVLKMLLDRRRVLSWIEEIAMHPIPQEDADWAREAAIHHASDFLPDLQSLVWEWSPEGTIFDFHLIPTALIQDAARMVLQ